MKILKVFWVSILMAVVPSIALAAVPKSECVKCHEKVNPGVVKQHMASRHFSTGVDCAICHGSDHKTMTDHKAAKMPTAATCATCHKQQHAQFKAGKHDLAWIAASSMPMWTHQPKAVTGMGYRGCSGCHKIGSKAPEEVKSYKYGHAQCDACHTRHTFSKKEAQDPRSCSNCHMGFDHPQWEMYMSSKHGITWSIPATSANAPTCQTCHMPNGDHNVMTAWGFLALRLPEDNKEWLNARVKILQYLGVLDEKGTPTERLELVKAGKVARLTKEEFQKERDKMMKVCTQCHSSTYAKDTLDAGDQIIKASDLLFAEVIGIVQDLYKDGILKKPAGWKYAPDGLQFYEAKSSIEQELYLIFLEYRMRAFQGAFHTSNDYMHWYGWAPLKEAVQRIKDEAKNLRAEHKK
ncbi:MAG: multiheme c-type cytochrome [Thermodesulfovibrionales bacterium]|nr:multiheme c-type cytochrome [Thermodesulfovibrionales bacterium]